MYPLRILRLAVGASAILAGLGGGILQHRLGAVLGDPVSGAHALTLLFSAATAVGIAQIRSATLLRYAWVGYVAVLVLVLACLPFGTRLYGAARWLAVGDVSIEPGQLAPTAVVLVLANRLSTFESQTYPRRYFEMAAYVLPMMIALMAQPHFRLALLVCSASAAMLFVANVVRARDAAMLLLSQGLATVMLVLIEPYRVKRLVSFMDPLRDPTNGNVYQAAISQYIIAHSGLSGSSATKAGNLLSFLPEATDAYAAIAATALGGPLAVAALLLPLIALVVAAYLGALRLTDGAERAAALGLTGVIAFQVALHIGQATGTLPSGSTPLPFISTGQTNAIAHGVTLGLLLSLLSSDDTLARRASSASRAPATTARGSGQTASHT